MGIIERELFKDVSRTLAIMLTGLVMVFFVSAMLQVMRVVASGLLGPELMFEMIGYELLAKAPWVMPPMYFFAVLWVLGRMYRESEIFALQAAGYSQTRLHVTMLLIGLPFTAFVGWLLLSVLPWANYNADLLKYQGRAEVNVHNLRPRQFHAISGHDVVFFAEQAGEGAGRLAGVFAQDRQNDRLGLIRAAGAYQLNDEATGERHVVLIDGRRYQGEPGEAGYAIGEFDEYIMRLPSLSTADVPVGRTSRSTIGLMMSSEVADRAEFHSRVSSVLAVSVFGVLGVVLARTAPRKDMYGRVILAIVIYISYINLQQVALAWFRSGVTPEWLGSWWVGLLMLLFSGVIGLADSNRVNRRMAAWRYARTGT